MSNPEYKAYGSARMRWIEKDEPGEFRDANEYLRGSRLAHTNGYYCDDFCDETAVPAVFITPQLEGYTSVCDECHKDPTLQHKHKHAPRAIYGSGEPVYYAAVRDPCNDGCGVVDFEESYADADDAARAAHSIAERYAEHEREYSENENSKIRLENLVDDVRELRNRHRYLIRALPVSGDDATGARMRADVRDRLTKLAKDIRECRSSINWEV
jgi:hypothetical protein